jgi:hypothetical protein
MTSANKLNIAGKTAIIAALLGGSSISFAQDVAPTDVAPVAAAPVATPVPEPIVTPPMAVRTLPGENDVVNPAAAQEAAAEAKEKRQASAVTQRSAKPNVATRTAAPVIINRTPSVAAASTAVSETSTADIMPTDNAIDPIVATVSDAAVTPPADDVAVEQDTGISNEDMTLFGGMAAALAAIGLGAAFASRRRRRRVASDNVVRAATPEYAAPRPIREDPAFQQFSAAPVSERFIRPAPVMTRPDVPITDPLFSTPVVAGPITDPMFAPKTAIEPPITDPLFAKHDRFAGRSRPAGMVTNREPELVN